MKIINLIKIISLILIIFLVVNTNKKEANLLEGASMSAKIGGEWLLNYPDKFNDPGIVWIVSEINNKYCSSSQKIKTRIEKMFIPFESHPIESAYIRLIEKDKIKNVPYESLLSRSAYYDDILIPSIYCDINPLPENIKSKILDGKNKSGYPLSHSFLSMEFFLKNNCKDDKIESENKVLAKKIAREERVNSFGDLYSERVAFLFYGGFGDLVEKEWILKIISNQQKSGGWKSNYFESLYFGLKENPHTTALSVWALSQYTKTCPFNLQ